MHGNREALAAVLKALEGEAVDRILCAGDIVGYGASPEACLDLIRKQSIPCVAGNHDRGVCGRLELTRFNVLAQTAIRWTRDHLRRSDFDFLMALPLTFQDDMVAMTHGTFDDPARFKYLLDSREAFLMFPCFDRAVGVVGHTHVPGFYGQAGKGFQGRLVSSWAVQDGGKLIMNVGSVGQPRDGDPRAAYAVYDTKRNRAQIKRVPYDIKSAQQQIRECGLPFFLSERLSKGI